jgi:predicted transcriptional regulator
MIVMSQEDMYYRLQHPVRKRIMEILGEEGKVRFTHLKDAINVGVGKLYYHLDILGNLISQDEHKRYMLTSEGERALKILKFGDRGVIYPQPPSEFDAVLEILTAKPILQILRKTTTVSFPALFLVIVLASFLNAQARLDPLFLFLLDKPEVSQIVILLKTAISPLVIFAFCDLTSTLLYRREGNHTDLLAGTVFSQIPLVIFSLMWILLRDLFTASPVIPHIVFFLFQGWSIILLIGAVTYSKELKFTQASLIVLAFTYINIALLNIPFLGG